MSETATVLFPAQDARVTAEVARTQEERTYGLSGRTSLPANRGMLFVFERPGGRIFTMRPALINLDMIFLDAYGVIVGMVENAQAGAEAPYVMHLPSLYVLEVAGGWARVHGVHIGDRAVIGAASAT